MIRHAYAIGDRVVTVYELPGVAALRRPAGGGAGAPRPRGPQRARWTELRWPAPPPAGVAAAERTAFWLAGWALVDVDDRLKFDWGGPSPPADAVRVFRGDAGALLVNCGLLVVRLRPEVTSAAAAALFAAYDLAVVSVLAFAPNLFRLVARRGRHVMDVVRALAGHRAVVYAEPEMDGLVVSPEDLPRALTPALAPAPARAARRHNSGYQWHLANDGRDGGVRGADIGAAGAWRRTRGGGVRIAVIDGGCHVDHPSLRAGIDRDAAANYRGGACGPVFVPGAGLLPRRDHGTRCAGMAGARPDPAGRSGVAPEATLIPVACFGGWVGSEVTLARAIAYAARPQCEGTHAALAGADVISCSLGERVWTLQSVLVDAFAFATSRGRGGLGAPIFVPVEGRNVAIRDDDICAHPLVTAVGATDWKDRPRGSAYGHELDFVAPGVDVTITAPRGPDQPVTGTSYATPCAAAAAALVIAANPTLSCHDVRDILRATCDTPGGARGGARSLSYGHGRINAARAVSMAVSRAGRRGRPA
jgi:thermitase